VVANSLSTICALLPGPWSPSNLLLIMFWVILCVTVTLESLMVAKKMLELRTRVSVKRMSGHQVTGKKNGL